MEERLAAGRVPGISFDTSHLFLIKQPGFWQVQARKVENRADIIFNYVVQREWGIEHTLDLLLNI